jgi:(p)ppGpp synthase/HD superfamily hydrolase
MTDDLIPRARAFAVAAHAGQTRKGGSDVPYVTHCETVAAHVARWGGAGEIVAAAWLHDTVEDCDGITADLIEREFGARVRGLVDEVTDDKSLPKDERKRLQIEHAPHASEDATLLKIADKLANVADLAAMPADGWPVSRRVAYLDWAAAVVAALPDAHPGARAAFETGLARARAEIGGTAT